MKNIHVLPTQNEITSKLFKVSDELKLTRKYDFYNGAKYQNIYITSDEDIKEGDWCVDTYKLKNNHNPIFKWSDKFKVDAKKIILTTDQLLDGVQAIDDEFLKWFVKNPSCEFVEFNAYPISPNGNIVGTDKLYPFDGLISNFRIDYKIIIPQEEPKQMSKTTAVDYLFNELIANPGNFIKAYKQAKEMEKEQIIDAASDHCYPTRELARIDAKNYYNETYKDK